ncbi:lipoprotein insertase outer membrane protein LolB [Methylovulum miyakonense]|uniref:lipoprotein insertase outer membrane protein LolB n=1 Tax=Methylovulum miyakonense TaxID=645578 RepID=UPI000363BBA6|nr:lipoprotein insertase outer membrane protein LolB [Methylovulum miyakonense]
MRIIFSALSLVLLLSACSSVDVAPDGTYSRSALQDLGPLAEWSLDGRLALSGNKDSWSASMAWEHEGAQDQLKLSGPLGQGATVVRLNGDVVSIDRGGGNVQTSNQPEAFVNQQLGMSVPIKALSHWIVGLPEPGPAFVDIPSGFRQSGWMVEYKQMQQVDKRVLPRKMTIMNDRVKLKLIIEQWVVKGSDGQ